MNQKKKKMLSGTALFCVSAVLLAGCSTGQERMEKKAAYRTIGINAMEAEDYEGAMEAFNSALEQASEIGENEIDICYYKAAAQFASGDFEGAIETYSALLESDGKNSDAYFLRGCVYLKRGDDTKAREDYAAAVKYAETDEIYLPIYYSLSGAGYEAEGKAYLDEALEKRVGRNAKNHTVKGRIYLIRGEYQEAVKRLKEAVEKGDVDANLYLAQAYEALGDAGQSEACIAAYVEEYPQSSVAFNQLGRKEMEAGNYQEAAAYFQEGLEQQEVTNEQQLRSNLIAAYEYSGDFEGAWELMEAYASDYPGDEAAMREILFLRKNRSKETEQE